MISGDQGETDTSARFDQDTYQLAWTHMIEMLQNRIPTAALLKRSFFWESLRRLG